MTTTAHHLSHQALPFSTNILWPPDQPPPPLESLLPGVFREESLPRLSTPSLASSAYLAAELGLGRLDGYDQHWFWLLGSPALPKPLHDCVHRGRTICITERMDRHLGLGLGGGGSRSGGSKKDLLYLKPLPRFLLDTRFWAQVLSCDCLRPTDPANEKEREIPAGTNTGSMHSNSSTRTMCDKRHLWDCALGFLYSYAALVAHESDFRTAQEYGLLPPEVTWSSWRLFSKEVATSPDVASRRFHKRFLYGELRLNRLREISQLKRGGLLPVLVGRLDRFARFFQQNVRWLASLVAYIAIVLSALQTGLTTDTLAASSAFQTFSSGFTLFALISPLSILFAFGLYFGLSIVYHVAVHLITNRFMVGAEGKAILAGADVFHHWDSKSDV
ncbi:hypothetical protein F503_07835 [Ophiostoma piceae UAMH 11346]|uniref:Uncharacterized protein n=1 Tax=Ophiostoma piceae (strain UAMH 11346) TaxID=1262450 RepID=S3C0Y4_OPHP1|nr:hypothetical protein F503_07835 [Ophiostoma piceae UAMH 11346]